MTTRRREVEHGAEDNSLSGVICWTRMQAEAGQGLEAIVCRKELERRAGDGLFCWGIGNAPPRSIGDFVRNGESIDVVFSKMKSRPKAGDVAPSGIVVWRSFVDAAGTERMLPPHVLVTSKVKEMGRAHYALMCRADHQLALTDMGAFDPSVYRNVSEAARPVGASQVTALLRRVATAAALPGYQINLRATLAKAYWARLSDPFELTLRKRAELNEVFADISAFSVSDWLEFVLGLRAQRGKRQKKRGEQLPLFTA